MNILTVDNISKSYGVRKIFDGASFFLQEGEKAGIIGINGTGKSTLLKMIAGLEEADDGTVIKANHCLVRYLPQNPGFAPGGTGQGSPQFFEVGGEKNMDWCLYGEDKRREIDRDLKPEYLLDDLRRYQDVFGEEFGVKELLMLEDIRVKAMIAGALADMPEFLVDQIGKANNSSSFPSVTRAMERIADVVEEKWEEERE